MKYVSVPGFLGALVAAAMGKSAPPANVPIKGPSSSGGPWCHMNRWIYGVVVVGLALLCHVTDAPAEAQQSVLREGDRVVVVGDSITGQSLGGHGYVTLMREALRHAHPDTKTTLTPLGGSGHTVGSWVGIEKDSRQRNFALDVPGVDVRKTLDGGADVVIIMLGMNNVLRPDMGDTPEAIAGWASSYRTLILALRERTHARVIALATPTLCTEDETSPKNVLMDRLSAAMINLAKANDCTILPVRSEFEKMLREGRTYRPDFHVTGDFVHPSPAGHLAIAVGMLQGLGEHSAAKWIYEDRSPAIWKQAAGTLPTLSYTLTPAATADAARDDTFKVSFWFTDSVPRKEDGTKPHVQLTVPDGWKVTPASVDGVTGQFTASGPLDRLQNLLTLTAQHASGATKAQVAIPAPWLIGVGNCGAMGWHNDGKRFVFDPDKGRLPIDAELIQGVGFGLPVRETADLKWGRPIRWSRYIASVNYPGGASPGSVDLEAAAWFGTFDVAYGVRWILSPTDRSITASFDSHTFAGDYFLSLWLNGQKVRASTDRRGTVELKLKKGWNALVLKCNHLEWQWQFDIGLTPAAGESLDDLRFSITPPAGLPVVP